MKDWWLSLSIREKQTVALGGFALLLFLVYLIIWSPLTNSITTMRTSLQQNQTLLAFMQAADKELKTQGNQTAITKKLTGSIQSIAQNQINQSPISSNLTQLRQLDADSVQLSFNQVSFDQLMTWLADSWQEQGFIITQISIHAINGAPGMVKAEIVLK